MAKVELVKELLAVAENKVWMLAEVSAVVSAAGVNIQAINAYGAGDKANFRMLSDDNQKAKTALEAKGYQVSEQDVVTVELPNQVGVLQATADKLKAKGIDLEYIYGTTCSCNCDCLLVLNSNNNAGAQEALK